ncbi:MAG TPA: tetratricopeptide repeat protein, partial [Gaiellaceae bacterium]|nr:tetratricopeptide repeat protein [Gaiellaceae bacterium]
ASHYLAAVEAAPEAEDAREIAARARTMLARAGERAAALAAPAEAERYFVQAAELADEPLDEAALRERAGEMAWTGGNGEVARRQLGRALALFEAAGETHPVARVSARLGEVEWQSGELDTALARMEQAFAVLAAEPHADVAALAAQLGRLHLFRGELDLAAERIETALALAERLRLPETVSHALNTSAMIAHSRERPETALALLRHALTVALEHDLSAAALRAHFNLAYLLSGADRHEEALAHHESGLALARKVGNRFWERLLLLNSAEPLLLLGRWDDASARLDEVPTAELSGVAGIASVCLRAELESARGRIAEAERALAVGEQFERSPDVQERLSYEAAKAVVLQARAQPAEALAAAEKTIESLDLQGWRSPAARLGLVAAIEAALALGELERAEQLIRSIEARPPGAAPEYLRAQAGRLQAAVLAARGGQDEEIERQLRTAAATFRELGLTFWTAVSDLELGEWLARHGDGDEAAALLAGARETFERLRARPWLERATAAGGTILHAVPATP